jgi:(1->4)-alpha-D-glucan 1-alpha-D-glucosylmutase
MAPTMHLEKNDMKSILDQLSSRARVPVSTYRLQLHKEFGFRDARHILPYLAELGVTDCYTSPILKARPGSLHGYDICDHHALNPDLGTPADYEYFVAELKALNVGHILDFVPNHMGVDPNTNPWWRDVLENGPGSPYAHFFDIHWNPAKPELKGKVLLPILSDQYGIVLERGELPLFYEKGRFFISYAAQRLPIDPKNYPQVLRVNLEALKAGTSAEGPALKEFLSIITAFENLPTQSETNPERVADRRREASVAQERLMRLVAMSKTIAAHIGQALRVMNGQPDQPASFDSLHQLLEAQAYRLSYWKTASHEINYRRFFDINDLAGLRVENEKVFPTTHEFVMGLVAQGYVKGLRIDHPDGLYDPAGYFEALQDLFLQKWVDRSGSGLTDKPLEDLRAWRVAERKKNPHGLAARPLYIAAEKILSSGESLDDHWVIDGTSGYDFLNDLNGLFVDSRYAERMGDLYTRFTGWREPYEKVAYICKKLIMSTSMASELNVLANALNRISERDRRSRDFTLDSLRDALKEVIACFSVYRTYINAARAGATDRQIIATAVEEAKRRNPAMEPTIFDFIRTVLTPENVEKVSTEEFKRQGWFTMKVQQYTAPVYAKGVEDTAFYRHPVLLSLNEVGGDPAVFGRSPEHFHERNQQRHTRWPYAMLATGTHDTKRGEDARARLNALSEIPEEWEHQLFSWAALNEPLRTRLGREWAPARHDEYLFYQALLGAWAGEKSGLALGDLRRRLEAYMLKAIKEAKIHTSWISTNEAYEKGVARFVNAVLVDDGSHPFFDAFIPFAERISHMGMVNSLSQLVLKIASPGVPDFYQGSEMWDFNLVDPDNRRSVDFTIRRNLLASIKVPQISTWLDHWQDGRIKLFITACGLRWRQQHPALFLDGDYWPLRVKGPLASHVVAFARYHENRLILAVAPRMIHSFMPGPGQWPLGDKWKTTSLVLPARLQGALYHNLFTEQQVQPDAQDPEQLPLSELLSQCPVGLFYADAPVMRS